VVRHPERPQKKKKKKTRKNGFGLWGWPDHPLGPGGGFGHPLPAVGGGFDHAQALGGGPATPKGQNPFFRFFFFFFFFWAFWGGRTTPKGLGVASATPYRPLGVVGATPLARNGVVRPPHFWERGGSNHPDFPFFYFLFFFYFLLFFKKKILKFAKLHRFGQNGVVLDEPKTA
jgi:hypothetical protein